MNLTQASRETRVRPRQPLGFGLLQRLQTIVKGVRRLIPSVRNIAALAVYVKIPPKSGRKIGSRASAVRRVHNRTERLSAAIKANDESPLGSGYLA